MISKFLGILTLFAAVYLLSAQPCFAERRVALIIGNSAYQNVAQLPNPANDAAAVAAMFKKAGFDVVETRLNVGNMDLRRTVREFTAITRNADIAVVYYAGHGIEFDGTNYLIPIDAELASDVDVEDETISLDRIMRMLDPVKRLRLIILDACRENPFARTMKRTIASRSIGRGLAKVEVATTDTLVAFAAKAGMTAADGNGQHSPFTTALLDNLTIPGLDLRIAFGRVRDEVMTNTDRKQEPYVYGSIGGSTVALVEKPKVPAFAKPTPAPVAPSADALARDDYKLAERIGTKEAWESYLAAHSHGFFANLARAARDKIVAAEKQFRLGSEAAKKAAEDARLKAEAATKAQQVPIVVATAPSAVEAKRSATPPIDPGDLARLLQFHLKRVGCDPGALDGNWTEKSMHALQEFNKREKTKFDVKVASIGALDAVRQQKARVCPMVCGRGFKAEGDRCVADACRRGYIRNKAGDCERETKSAARPAQREESGGGGQIYCGRQGCQQVPKNCHLRGSPRGDAGSAGYATGASGESALICN
jgi:uncharacterized caspase-like protein